MAVAHKALFEPLLFLLNSTINRLLTRRLVPPPRPPFVKSIRTPQLDGTGCVHEQILPHQEQTHYTLSQIELLRNLSQFLITTTMKLRNVITGLAVSIPMAAAYVGEM